MDPGPSCPGSPPPPAGPPPPGGPPLGHAFPARRRWGGERHLGGGEGLGSARLSGRAARREASGESERLRGASRRGRGQTQDWARCCPLRFPVVQGGGCCTARLREAAGPGGTLGTPLGLPSLRAPLLLSFFLPLSRSPSSLSPILLGVPSRGPVASSSTTTGLGQWLAQVAEGWSGHDRRAGLFPWRRRWRQRKAAAGEAARRRQQQNWSVI